MDLQEIEKLIDKFDEIIFENNSDIYDEYSDFDDLLFEINQRIIIHRDFFYNEELGDKYYDLEDLEENYLDEYDEEDMVNNMFPNRNDRAEEDSFDDGFDLDKHFGLD